ncbi:Ankyrin repeat domain-containing protein 17 [Durusdinium trenchii]|uniref:Ankyrin repeat domain-containing protein 17 n=1 Tax=Durusdinium trenchii TaxID=1381693 RepID=A0ABP0Q120_9DINO
MDRAALTSHCPPGTSLSPAPTWTRPPAATLAPWTRCGLQLGMLTLAAFQGSGLLPRCHARLATSKWKRSRVTRPSAQGVPEDARALLLFWFGPEIFEAPQRMNELEYLRARKKMWYTSGGKYDEASRQFLPMLRQYDASKDEWQEEGSDQLQLAKVVLFDQIPWNVFRGTSDAFRYDEKACAASEVLIDSDFSRRCSAAELLCIVQPFVHAEGPGDSRVQHAIHILQKNMRRFPEDASNMLFQAILSHDAHGRVLRTFGRYPHRNTLLGRRSSPEELQPERAGDGSLHSKSFAHTDKGMYFMGMTLMNYKSAPSNQPWIELRHPQKLRWSQGCGVLRLKAGFGQGFRRVHRPDFLVESFGCSRRGTTNNSDPIVEGIFDRKVDPHGENYSWFLVPDEDTLEMTLDKDKSEVYQTFSYGTLLWPRLFNDDIPLGCLAIRNVHSCPTGWPRLDRNR